MTLVILVFRRDLCIEEKKLSDIFYSLAEFIKEYELKQENLKLKNDSDDETLYKLKDILEMYPMLTTYSVNKAVNDKRLTATQLGKTRFYKRKDIEKFLELNKKDAFSFRRN